MKKLILLLLMFKGCNFAIGQNLVDNSKTQPKTATYIFDTTTILIWYVDDSKWSNGYAVWKDLVVNENVRYGTEVEYLDENKNPVLKSKIIKTKEVK